MEERRGREGGEGGEGREGEEGREGGGRREGEGSRERNKEGEMGNSHTLIMLQNTLSIPIHAIKHSK